MFIDQHIFFVLHCNFSKCFGKMILIAEDSIYAISLNKIIERNEFLEKLSAVTFVDV